MVPIARKGSDWVEGALPSFPKRAGLPASRFSLWIRGRPAPASRGNLRIMWIDLRRSSSWDGWPVSPPPHRHGCDILPQGPLHLQPLPRRGSPRSPPLPEILSLTSSHLPEPDANTSSFRIDFPSACIPAAGGDGQGGPCQQRRAGSCFC